MNKQHTPGPWSAGISMWKGQEVFSAVEVANPKKITAVCGVPGAPDEQESIANASLISAAPELLAFAQEFLKDYQSEDGMASMKHYARAAQAAIAKATQEPSA